MTYKVDIHKAFDTLSWKFLLLVLTSLVFHPLFVGWISTILCSAMLSIRINSSLVGFFLIVEVSDKVILCLLYFFLSLRKFLIEVSLSLWMIRKFNIWLVRKIISLPPIFYMLMTYLVFVGGIISLLEI